MVLATSSVRLKGAEAFMFSLSRKFHLESVARHGFKRNHLVRKSRFNKSAFESTLQVHKHDYALTQRSLSRQPNFEDISATSTLPENEDIIVNAIQQAFCGSILPQVFGDHGIPSKCGQKVDYPEISSSMIVLVGVSGGCDSVALLHSLANSLNPCKGVKSSPFDNYSLNLSKNNTRRESGSILMSLHVVHFDHQQRGRESTRDREFVESLCQSYGIPFHPYFWSKDFPENNAPFSQEKARDWRQMRSIELIQSLQQSTGSAPGIIMSAHHANDQEETILLKLLRGVHISEIRGMESLLPALQHMDPGPIFYSRPFLQLTKQQLEQYLKDNNWEWREDASNLSNKYKRNRIRNEVIPLLEDIVGGSGILRVSISFYSSSFAN